MKDTLVFNHNLFIQFMEQKNYLNDSYTQFKNKVGLTIDGKYLKQRNEVALVWPFKDCILEVRFTQINLVPMTLNTMQYLFTHNF